MQSKYIVNEVPDYQNKGFFSLDQRWQFTFLDRQTAKIIDGEIDNLIGKVIWKELPDFTGTAFETSCRSVMEDGRFRRLEIINLDTAKKYLTHIFPIFNGISVFWEEHEVIGQKNSFFAENYFISPVTDAGLQDKCQQKPFKSEEKYRNLFNLMDEGYCIIDMIFDHDNRAVDYRYIEANPAFKKQTGLSNPVGRLARELNPSIENYWLENLGKVALTGEPMHICNEAKGSNRWYRVNAFKVDYDNNLYVAVLFNDITNEIRYKNKLLDNIKMQEDVFANVSHELKTPLNLIYSTVQLLELKMRNESRDNFQDNLTQSIKIIKQNCYRFTKLINNLVDLSKMDSGFYKLFLQNDNIVEVTENVVQSVLNFIQEKGLNIIFDGC